MTNTPAPIPACSLTALTRRAREHLVSLGYSHDALRHYDDAWRRLLTFAHARGFADELSDELIDQFFAECGVRPTSAERTSYQRLLRRSVTVLGDIAVHGAVRRRMSSIPGRVATPLRGTLTKYLDHCARHLGARPSTLRVRRQHLEAFLVHLHQHGVDAAAAIAPSHISAFIRTRAHYAAKTTALTVTTLRSFLRVGFALGWFPADLSSELPRIHVRPDAKVPSVWSDAQVAALLGAVDLASPRGRRDRAILLLACRLGMRAGDIRSLVLDALRWPTASIVFAQQKTGATVELPMPDEVAQALIDYLRYGRPKTLRREVFLRGNAPFEPFGSDNNLHHVITRYRRIAGVALPPTARRGLHSLRHTLATRMLASGVPLETIGTILGHQSLDVTQRYTKVDIDALRSAALDLPEVTP